MLFGSIVAIGLVAVLVAIAVENPPPPPGAGLGERVYYRYCVDCHGQDGRGSWRALLFVIRPGDLTDAARMRADSDEYLRMLIKHGGAPLGKPGMPAFEGTLDDRQIDAVIGYVRGLSRGALPAGDGAVGRTGSREQSPRAEERRPGSALKGRTVARRRATGSRAGSGRGGLVGFSHHAPAVGGAEIVGGHDPPPDAALLEEALGRAVPAAERHQHRDEREGAAGRA